MTSTLFSERKLLTEQVRLLGLVAPFVAAETCFALKGGTALNVFWYDLPRLSVDLDLVFLPRLGRRDFLEQCGEALNRIQAGLAETVSGLHVDTKPLPGSSEPGTLFIHREGVSVKVEVNAVHRESLYAPSWRDVSPNAQPVFGPTRLQLLSFPETCAGKFNAALDRQHPRDLFDVGVILDSEGVGEEVRIAFVVNLLTQSRPFAHTLNPVIREPEAHLLSDLREMTEHVVDVDALVRNLVDLKYDLCDRMPPHHREFLSSFTLGHPDWSLLEVPQVDEMPAVRWRLQQMESLSEYRRRDLASALQAVWTDYGNP